MKQQVNKEAVEAARDPLRRKTPVVFAPTGRQVLGARGEEIAVLYLQGRGYNIIDRNVHYATGEIDIVASFGTTIVFVEVKTRTGDQYGLAESVSSRKYGRLRKSAGAWLANNTFMYHESVQFDVIGVVFEGSAEPKIYHWEGVDHGAR